ncbi:unnamed protein product [Thlaspi arvense]|uniref:Uncharacterized protein n=1 Tax=Thlaspi arvense TaxID=13288 RepID=A0AAU9T892_THLAR|nr:unnamed protein product [Thlaspi arvense]
MLRFSKFCSVLGNLVSWLVSIGSTGMFYGPVAWDPWLILAQIVCLQCLYYLTLGVFMTLLVGTRVSRLSLVYFFDYATVAASIVTGWCVIAAFLLSSLAEYTFAYLLIFTFFFFSTRAVYLLYLIERAKKCLDFAATVYIIHLFICIAYGGWPSSMTWWVVNGIGLAIMSLLGEYLCVKRELREIPISRYRPSKPIHLLHFIIFIILSYFFSMWLPMKRTLLLFTCMLLFCHLYGIAFNIENWVWNCEGLEE